MYFTTWIIHLNILLHLHVILYVDNGFFLKINRAVKDIYVKTKCTNRWILNPYKGAFIGYIVQSNPVVCVGAKFFSIKKMINVMINYLVTALKIYHYSMFKHYIFLSEFCFKQTPNWNNSKTRHLLVVLQYKKRKRGVLKSNTEKYIEALNRR